MALNPSRQVLLFVPPPQQEGGGSVASDLSDSSHKPFLMMDSFVIDADAHVRLKLTPAVAPPSDGYIPW